MSERKYFFLGPKKLIFIGVMHCVRERLFSKFFFFGKQPIENKPQFYKSFLLTKDSFPLTNLFLYYQTLENVENYLYRKFSNKTNKAFLSLIQGSTFSPTLPSWHHHHHLCHGYDLISFYASSFYLNSRKFSPTSLAIKISTNLSVFVWLLLLCFALRSCFLEGFGFTSFFNELELVYMLAIFIGVS